MNPAIPHHSLKVGFQLFIPLIISARLILGVIFKILCNLTCVYPTGLPDMFQFIVNRVFYRLMDLCAVVKKLCPHRKKGNISLCRILPFTAFQFFVLGSTARKHSAAELCEAFRQIILFQVF